MNVLSCLEVREQMSQCSFEVLHSAEQPNQLKMLFPPKRVLVPSLSLLVYSICRRIVRLTDEGWVFFNKLSWEKEVDEWRELSFIFTFLQCHSSCHLKILSMPSSP